MRDTDQVAVLAFRGTEQDFGDIKTDLNARFYRRNSVKMHSGFRDAFVSVEQDIREALAAIREYKLYITGHSLGGALALIAARSISAARSLSADNVAACYTFGSPKVGNEEFGYAIKVPIYRVVNAADLVPRLPPTWFVEILIAATWLLPVPYARGWLLKVLQRFRGYRHHGDMRYLTACKDDFSNLHLIPNPNLIDRGRRLLLRIASDWKAGFRDHGIATYIAKLEAFATKRLADR